MLTRLLTYAWLLTLLLLPFCCNYNSFLCDEHSTKNPTAPPFTASDWHLASLGNSALFPPDAIPQQNNGHDCGVFMCAGIAELSEDHGRRERLTFSQDKAKAYRRYMACAILNSFLP